MNLQGIRKKIVQLRSDNIEELMEELNVKVIYDSSLNKKDKDAVLITGLTKSVIFVKDDIRKIYRDFLLLHECGHLIYHFRPRSQFSYLQSQYCGRMEKEANSFACLYLLRNEELEDVCIIDLLISKGVPQQIAIEFVEEYR